MRDMDRLEMFAFDKSESAEDLAYNLASFERFHWVACRDERRIAIISVIEQSRTLWRVGMFATNEWPSIARACTKFLCKAVYPMLYDLGCNRAECRSHIDHVTAHRWLERLGARRECIVTDLGIDRERYIQYAWTRTDIDQNNG